MAGCCDARGCDRTFTPKFARRRANRYRRHGLDATAQRIVDALADRGVEGATVLEIGGGVGEVGLELLKRGAATVTCVELSPAYDAEARALADEAHLGDRVQRRIVDIAADPAAVEAADIVVLNRVVCCYPDYARLLGAAADRTRDRLVFSHPVRNLVSRAVLGAENLGHRLRRSEFRVFAHPPRAMLAVLDAHGLQPSVVHRGRAWQVAAGAR